MGCRPYAMGENRTRALRTGPDRHEASGVDRDGEGARGVELRLFRHGDDHVIMVDGNELMSSRVGGSEEALALDGVRAAAARVVEPHLLIGGYGMGFHAARGAGCDRAWRRATVAELVPEIIDWARGRWRR